MRRLSLMLIVVCVLSAPDARAISATDLATRDGEVAFGEAWLRSMRGRLGERIDPFCIDLLETWLIRLRNHYPLGEMPLKACVSVHKPSTPLRHRAALLASMPVCIWFGDRSEIMAVLAHELAHLSPTASLPWAEKLRARQCGSLATLAKGVAAIATRQGQAAQSLIIRRPSRQCAERAGLFSRL